jgi:hypothetical protein
MFMTCFATNSSYRRTCIAKFCWAGCIGEPLLDEVSEAMTEKRNALKPYMNDVGLLTYRLMGNTDIDILNHRSE